MSEVIPAIDARFRTHATRAGRGIGGKSSGGFGALVLAMRHEAIFSAVACHSGDAYFELSVIPDIPKAVRTLRRHRGVEGFVRYFASTEAKRSDDITTMMMLALGACYSPDPSRPLGIALPFDLETGELDWEVWRRWKAWDPVEMVAAHASALRALKLLVHRRRHARRVEPGPGRARAGEPPDRAARAVRAPGVRRRAPLDQLPLRRLAAEDGGGAGGHLSRAPSTTGPAPGATVTVTCDDLDEEGAATGEIRDGEGDVAVRVHVAGALPGETVVAAIDHRSPHRPEAWASLRELVAPSPHRRPPACRAFGPCGGCVLEHLAYEEQLRWKTDTRARDRRRRAGAARRAGRRLRRRAAPARLPQPIQAGVRARRDGALLLGAYAPRSHAMVDLVGGCRIAEPPLDDVAA